MLTFNLKKEWFEKIKSGEKTHEYRVNNDYWFNRLFPILLKVKHQIYRNKTEIQCIFACGYPRKEDIKRRIYAKMIQVSYLNSGLQTDLKINKPVYDIEFELLEDK